MKKNKIFYEKSQPLQFQNFLFESKKNVVQSNLESQWENFLFIYKENKTKISSLNDINPFFSKKIKIEFSQLNYVMMAKLISNKDSFHSLQKKIHNLGKCSSKRLQLEKVFSKFLRRKRFFHFLINYLFLKKLNNFFLQYQGHLIKSELIGKKQKVKSQNVGDYFLFHSTNYLILNIFLKKLITWLCKINLINKFSQLKIQTNTNVFNENQDKNQYSLDKTNYISLKKNTNRLSLKEVSVNKKMNKFQIKNILKLIKSIINKNKTVIQIELIKKINDFLKKRDTFLINTFEKTESRKFNTIFYSFLWRWGFSRHKKKTAKWIKNKYWYRNKENFSFSV
jgi:hypothetical protein